MKTTHTRQDGGFALIMAMIILFVLTILVVNAVRSSSMNEKMAGSYMERNRAMQAAEQALREGENRLMALDATNEPLCLSGCEVRLAGVDKATEPGALAIPASWGEKPTNWANAPDEIQATPAGQTTKASYKIVLLDNSLRAADKDACKAYSIMGRGEGLDSRTEVFLQTIAYACPM